MSHDADVDALIVGAGPVGLYAAYCAGFRGQSVAVMDSLPEIGGQVCAMYPEKLIYDIAGFPAVRGRDLISGLAEQVQRLVVLYLLGEDARALANEDETTQLKTQAVTAGFGFAADISVFSPRAGYRRAAPRRGNSNTTNLDRGTPRATPPSTVPGHRAKMCIAQRVAPNGPGSPGQAGWPVRASWSPRTTR